MPVDLHPAAHVPARPDQVEAGQDGVGIGPQQRQVTGRGPRGVGVEGELQLAAGVLAPRFVEGLLQAAPRPTPAEVADGGPGEHGNVRGPGYYH